MDDSGLVFGFHFELAVLGLGLGQESCTVYGVFGAGGGVGMGSGSDDIRRVAGSSGSLLVRYMQSRNGNEPYALVSRSTPKSCNSS